MTTASPTRSKPSCRSVSPCRRPRCRTARSGWVPRCQWQRSPPVQVLAWPSSALPLARAQAWALPSPNLWRSLQQRPVLARGMSPHTTPQSQPEMSVFATRTTGSLIIVTGRWPERASRRRGWIAGKWFFGKAVTALLTAVATLRLRIPVTSRRRIKNAGFDFSPSAGAHAAFATAHRSIAADPRRRNCANARRHPAPPSRH